MTNGNTFAHLEPEARIDALLHAMTRDEKALLLAGAICGLRTLSND